MLKKRIRFLRKKRDARFYIIYIEII